MPPPDPKTPRVVLLGATFDTGNCGVSALAAGAIRCMRERFSGASVSLMDYAKAPSVHTVTLDSGQELPVELVNMRFSKKFYLSNNIAWLLMLAVLLKLIPSRKLRAKIVRENTCLRTLDEAACVASIAGGDSFSDIYGMGRLLYVALPQILVLLRGGKLVLLPQTIGPFYSPAARAIARYILRRADTIYTRDQSGCEEIRALVGAGRLSQQIAFCHDVGFILTPRKPSEAAFWGLDPVEQGDTLAGINVSGLLLMGGYNQANMFGLKVDYGTMVQRIIEVLLAQPRTKVVLIPHVMGDDSESDQPACEKLYAQLSVRYGGRIGLVRHSCNESEIKYMIGLCDYFVGSRMHACIAALSQCVPATAIAYSDKFIGVLDSVGVESVVADARQLEVEEIVSAVAASYANRQATRHRLEQRIPEIKESILHFFRARALALPGGI